MGATNFLHFQEGKSGKEAYEIVRDKALQWFRDDPYNGTISTTDFYGTVSQVADVWDDEAKEAACEAVEARDYGMKWECRAIDCGSTKDGLRMWALFGWAAC